VFWVITAVAGEAGRGRRGLLESLRREAAEGIQSERHQEDQPNEKEDYSDDSGECSWTWGEKNLPHFDEEEKWGAGGAVLEWEKNVR